MSSTAEVQCKELCVRRCLFAVAFGIGIQYLLLTIFLLLVNFSIIHPITWLSETFSLICSFSTWFYSTPLIAAIIIYSLFLGQSFLSVKHYYPTRFAWIWATAIRKFLFFVMHVTVGLFTAWLYSRFLSDDYRLFFKECFGGYCLNGKAIFLTLAGVYSSVYYFFIEHLRKEPEILFPIIQECKYVKIRSQLYSIVYKSLAQSLVPLGIYTLLYWMLSWTITSCLASVFGVEPDDDFYSFYSIISNVRLMLYTLILSSQILSNMYLLNACFIIVLTQEESFLIEKDAMITNGQCVTIVEALSLTKVPIAQHLASLDLFNLSLGKNSGRRQQIFSLSIPGGHPYNWNQLSSQCLSMINAYTEQLTESIKKFSSPGYTPNNQLKPPATQAAEKILIQQYNQSFGIRNLSMQEEFAQEEKSSRQDACKKVNDFFDQLGQIYNDACRAAFLNIPGLFYMFGEQDGAKTSFILANSQDIIWITQALASLCASSINEDRYGVVQKDLPAIIRSYLKLKTELDKVCNLNLNGRKVDRNCFALRNAVKRSLYKICTVFGDYAQDLFEDADEIRKVRCYVNYLET